MEGGGRVETGTSSTSWVCEVVVAAQSNGLAQAEDKRRDNEEEETEGEDEEADVLGFVPGPLIPLKEQLEKDKDDESLKRWKEKLLGSIDGNLDDQMDPVVTFHSIGIVSEGCAEVVTPLPMNSGNVLFTLREGNQYCLKLTFSVQYNIVSGLTYSNTVWKGGRQVDRSRGMLGTFAPQQDPYTHMLDEETTPSGVLARGAYRAKLKFEDDDKRCHLEFDYTFEIKKR